MAFISRSVVGTLHLAGYKTQKVSLNRVVYSDNWRDRDVSGFTYGVSDESILSTMLLTETVSL